MTDPERLLDGDLPSDIARLLSSAESDVPPEPERKQRRIVAAFGLGAPLGSASSHPPQGATSAKRWVGLAAAAIVIGAAIVVMTTFSNPAPSPPSAPAPNAEVVTVAAPSGEIATAPPAMPSLRVDELPTAAPAARPAPASPTAAPATVEDELKTIDAARGALASRRPEQALAQVERYRVTFANPHFVDEADALEVQALAALGRTDEAKSKAERFLKAHPDSPYTQRVQSATTARAPSPPTE
jgi:hypothetical protein